MITSKKLSKERGGIYRCKLDRWTRLIRWVENRIKERVYVEFGDILVDNVWGAKHTRIVVTEVSEDKREFKYKFLTNKGKHCTIDVEYSMGTAWLADRYIIKVPPRDVAAINFQL